MYFKSIVFNKTSKCKYLAAEVEKNQTKPPKNPTKKTLKIPKTNKKPKQQPPPNPTNKQKKPKPKKHQKEKPTRTKDPQPSPENTQTRSSVSKNNNFPCKMSFQSAQNLLKCPVFTDVHFPLEDGSK